MGIADGMRKDGDDSFVTPYAVGLGVRLYGSTSGSVGFAPGATITTVDWTLPTADGTSGQVLSTDGAGTLSWVSHNSIAGLTTGDPHTQYALLAGRSGGQIIIGGTASGNVLELRSTSHATKGYVLIGTSDRLHVLMAGSVGTPAIGTSVVGVFQRNSANANQCFVDILAGRSATSSGIQFGDQDAERRAWLDYAHSTDTFTIGVAGQNAMTIDSSLNTTIRGMLIFDRSTLTIATGAITVTKTTHTVDTESAAATDDLDTINGGSTQQILILNNAVGARSVVVKHGTGNIKLVGSADFTLDNPNDSIMLRYTGSAWVELLRANVPA